nr:anti-sigma factor [Cellulosimicrobium arenosum]
MLESDPDARRELDEFRDVVAAFAVEQAPPASVRDSVLARVADTPQVSATPRAGSASGVTPLRAAQHSAGGRARVRWGLVAAAAAAVVAVGVPTTVAVRATQEQQRLEAQADTVDRMLADPSATIVRSDVTGGGEASVLVAGDDFLFRASDLPDAGDDSDYQLWVVDAEGAATSAGVLSADGGSVEQLVEDVPGTAVAMTVEPEGGSQQPTTEPIVVLGA